ncbi:MAG: crossover junction endodeoxyribonuclease RuvC [Spirochaetes bacterium]|nr:crossover junction endodeoxyribonuclease RuvC [Spirochaetota bacterium]
MAKLLGIDPGYGRCGWAVIDDTFSYIDCGVIETKSNDENRLLRVYNLLSDVIIQYTPVSCGIEKLFFNKNISTAIPVSQVIGVIKLLLIQQSIPYVEYTPLQVKQSITGYGRASKEQLANMIKKILKPSSHINHDDAFDALAIALCHCLALPRYSSRNNTLLVKKEK